MKLESETARRIRLHGFSARRVEAGCPAAACLRLAEQGLIELGVSDELLAEVRDVLNRPRIQNKFPALTSSTVDQFLLQLRRYAFHVADFPAAFSLDRDPKDPKYLNLAAAANATNLVSRDNDLLELVRRENAEYERFRKVLPRVAIVDPVEFLRAMQPPDTTESPPPVSNDRGDTSDTAAK